MSNDAPRTPTIADRIEELRTLYHRELLRPAPSEDCFKIEGDPDWPYGDLHPDLSTYTASIASCCRGAKTLLSDTTESLLKDRSWFSRTFFERWPLYADLEKLVTRDETPKLYRELEVYEHARRLVLELIQAVLESRGEAPHPLDSWIAPDKDRLLPRQTVGSSLPASGSEVIDEKRFSKRRSAQELVKELRPRGYGELAPYEDCLRIMGDLGGPYGGLKFDLEGYMYTISSFARAAKKLTTDSTDSLLASQARFSQTFFEAYPRYASLERLVTRTNTPTLWKSIKSYERTRKLLLELIQVVLDSREQNP